MKRWCLAAMVAVFAMMGFAAQAQAPEKILLFTQPIPIGDSLWMADRQGFFKDANLDVTLKWWPSGTAAMQTFQAGRTGQRGFGDINGGGDLPALNFWQSTNGEFAVIAVIERDGDGYNGIAKSTIRTAQDLKGKILATRTGSAAQWFLTQYMMRENLRDSDVTVKNLEPQIMPSALDRGDIDAFFMWEPYGSESLKISGDRVHRLVNGGSFFNGYMLIGTWKWYLREHRDAVVRLLKAIDRGRAYAEGHEDDVIDYARTTFSMQDTAAIGTQWGHNGRVVGLDKTTWDDFLRLAAWMKTQGMATRDFDPSSFFDAGPMLEAFPDRVSSEFRH